MVHSHTMNQVNRLNKKKLMIIPIHAKYHLLKFSRHFQLKKKLQNGSTRKLFKYSVDYFHPNKWHSTNLELVKDTFQNFIPFFFLGSFSLL